MISKVYKTQIISTIVDAQHYNQQVSVYKTQIISTIVDFLRFLFVLLCL